MSTRETYIAAINADTAKRKKALGLLHEARNEGRGTPNTDAAVERLTADIREAEEAIRSNAQRVEYFREQEASEHRANEARANSPIPFPVRGPSGDASAMVDIFDGLRSGSGRFELELRDAVTLKAGVATDGAETVQTDVLSEVVRKEQAESDWAQIGPRVLMTAAGDPVEVPVEASSSDVLIEGEGDAIATSSPQFTTVSLGAHKFAVVVPLSSELIQDASMNIVRDFVIPQGVQALNRKMSTDFVSGAGTTEPTGIDLAASTGLTTAAAAAVTFDELIEAVHSVIPQHRRNAKWVMSSATIEAIRKLKDGDSNYIWQPSVQVGVPPTLLGYPVIESPDIANMGTGNTFGVFGDFQSGSIARMAGPLRVDISTQAGFVNDIVYVRFIQRFDSNLLVPGAIKKLVNA